jgi:addiction module HigA family antidote
MSTKLENMTPGEILLEDYMKPMGLTQNALARDLGVPPRRVNEIIHGKRAITLDTSLRLGRYFGQSPRFWLNVQTECDLRNAKQLVERIAREVHPKPGMVAA